MTIALDINILGWRVAQLDIRIDSSGDQGDPQPPVSRPSRRSWRQRIERAYHILEVSK